MAMTIITYYFFILTNRFWSMFVTKGGNLVFEIKVNHFINSGLFMDKTFTRTPSHLTTLVLYSVR